MMQFKCTKKDFPIVDMFLHMQEFEKLPEISDIVLDVQGVLYKYKVVQELNGLYYIITQ